MTLFNHCSGVNQKKRVIKYVENNTLLEFKQKRKKNGKYRAKSNTAAN